MSKYESGPFNCPLMGCFDPYPHKHTNHYLVSLVDSYHISVTKLQAENATLRAEVDRLKVRLMGAEADVFVGAKIDTAEVTAFVEKLNAENATLRASLLAAQGEAERMREALAKLEQSTRILLSQIDYGFLTWKAELHGTTKVIENARNLLSEAVRLTPHPALTRPDLKEKK